ncbi:glycosyltransferase, partial [uncultured Aeromicrobium sp.]|uniref:glycosyltransferase n=1 Tax=uncultured Aeromicrobium sp. TaxID=337820 RepID=UPI0025EE36A7
GEQALNAHPVVEAGGGLLIDDDAFTAAWVENVLIALVTDGEQLAAMSRAASDIVRADAAERLAAMIHAAGAGR